MAKTQEGELFRTVSRGFDKEEVTRYLQRQMENHAAQQEQMQLLADEKVQAAARAEADLALIQQELGEALYDQQMLTKEMERLRREKQDADQRVVLADKLLANLRAEVAATKTLRDDMEHSLSQALEQNCRLEQKLAEQGVSPDLQAEAQLRQQVDTLSRRNEELEAQLAAIRRKVMEAARARQARREGLV